MQGRSGPRELFFLCFVVGGLVVTVFGSWRSFPIGHLLQRGIASGRFGFLFFLAFGFLAQGGDGIGWASEIGEGAGILAPGEVLESEVFGVVEVLGECLGYGVEFVFDHDVDVVVLEAGLHFSIE